MAKRSNYSEVEDNWITAVVILAVIFSAILGWFVGIFIFSPPVMADGSTYICTTQKGTWVNVRATPDPNGHIVGTLRYGYEVEAESEENGYLKIKFNDSTAYVRHEFFEIPMQARGIATCRVIMRAKPNGKKLRHLNPGNHIDILAKTVDADGTPWYRCYGNVYIMSRYLEVSE